MQVNFFSFLWWGCVSLRVCLHGGGGSQVGGVIRLGGVEYWPSFTCNLTILPSRGALSQDYWMVAKHVNKKNAGKPRVSRLMLFYTHLLLLLRPSVLWFSIATLKNDAKPSPNWSLRKFDVSRIRPRLGGLLDLETFTWQNLTPAGRVTRCQTELPTLAGHLTYYVNVIKLIWEVIWTGGLPHLSELPHLPGVPHLHVNTPLVSLLTYWLDMYLDNKFKHGEGIAVYGGQRSYPWSAACIQMELIRLGTSHGAPRCVELWTSHGLLGITRFSHK